MLTHTQITYFLTIARCRSFSEAARQLFITQSAISKQISNLEKQLDIKLFERNNKTTRLTPAGEVLCRELQKYDEWLAYIVSIAKLAEQGKNGSLNIGILHGVDLSDSAAPLLQAFSKAYPENNIHVRRLFFQDIVSELLQGSVDLVIALSFLVPSHMNISQHVIRSERDMIIVAKTNSAGKTENIIARDLISDTFVTISPDISRQAYKNSLGYLNGLGITPVNVKLVNTIEDIMLNVESGLGFGVSSQSCRLFGKEHIRFVDMYKSVGVERHMTDVVAVWHKNCVNPSVISYINFISSEKI
ncbi:MAG: LysR family transcriptional regulator [Clostridiales Family XIII bacterium]|jgi:DNA-binding transcriptional LysR family regulator|nr:LysR family transcriptional regulator [Clostridiales Family XIII bacterium]